MKELSVIFDGKCMLCNRFIHFLLKRNKTRFKYISNCSETGKALLTKHHINTKNNNTIYLIGPNYIAQESDAVINILKHCDWKYKALATLINLIPKYIRDKGYRFVAKRRHCIGSVCYLPSDKERSQIIF